MHLLSLLPYARVIAYAALGYLLIRINLNTGNTSMAIAMATVFTSVAILLTLFRR